MMKKYWKCRLGFHNWVDRFPNILPGMIWVCTNCGTRKYPYYWKGSTDGES